MTSCRAARAADAGLSDARAHAVRPARPPGAARADGGATGDGPGTRDAGRSVPPVTGTTGVVTVAFGMSPKALVHRRRSRA